MPSAIKASAPKTALTIMSWDERSLMGMSHMVFVELTATRASLRVHVSITQAWIAVVRGAEVQMQVVFVGRQVVWVERAEEKHFACGMSVFGIHIICLVLYLAL
jgi:hypothetical protein